MSDFVAALHQRLLVGDGAMGTMLHSAGNSLDRALPELNLSAPDLVSRIHESYVGAGADLVLTNTFGASRLRLAEHGYAAAVADINRAGVRLAQQAANTAEHEVFVGGSVAPAVSATQRPTVQRTHRIEAVQEQVAALVAGGVDLIVLETFGYLDELVEAVEVVAELTDLPILAQATFTTDGSTPGGQTPSEVASVLDGLPIAALGANCTVGPQRMLRIVEDFRRHTRLPISAQPNAGLPRRVLGRHFEYSLDHEYFARYTRRCVEAGASILGGCCGTTPAHVNAVAAVVSSGIERRVKRPPRARTAPVDDLAQLLSKAEPVVGAEIHVPAGGTVDRPGEVAAALRSHGAELVLISAAPGPRTQVGSAGLALRIRQQAEIETIAIVTTWDKTIMSLQADLLGAHAFGIRAVVCETGSPPLRGDYPNADGVWEVDSVDLIRLLTGLNAGRDCNGLPLNATTSFHIGARCNPGAEDLAAEISSTRKKIEAGAQFLITRPLYELDGLRRMLDEIDTTSIPVLATISVLESFAEAEFLAFEVPDVTIPAATLADLEAAGTLSRESGIRRASELVREARALVSGIVVVVRGHETTVAERLFAELRKS
ncbi:bifunctional homocysteine S-methyltransferase/methylenetetrahydrofolate reductase [Nocardia sp. NPDC059246]|uniref:bifunctional homocysteine S-methyltransferase/methylenetetrahydrofolate reductase n=1 Tax=unclassified Nocardia TaxID=2637762 RepID=UPI0036809E24